MVPGEVSGAVQCQTMHCHTPSHLNTCGTTEAITPHTPTNHLSPSLTDSPQLVLAHPNTSVLTAVGRHSQLSYCIYHCLLQSTNVVSDTHFDSTQVHYRITHQLSWTVKCCQPTTLCLYATITTVTSLTCYITLHALVLSSQRLSLMM